MTQVYFPLVSSWDSSLAELTGSPRAREAVQVIHAYQPLETESRMENKPAQRKIAAQRPVGRFSR